MGMEEFIKAYIAAALFSTNDESTPSGGEPLDKKYSEDDISPETLAEMKADCEKFRKENAELLEKSGMTDDEVGHDLWLSRNGHGSGFFDEFHVDKDVRDALQEAAGKMGESNLYVGDDGKIYA